MLSGLLIAGSLIGSVAIWLFSIRPYCIQHKHGHQTGANFAVALWTDWQQAKEIASQDSDAGMLAVCRVFSAFQVLLGLGVLLLLFGG